MPNNQAWQIASPGTLTLTPTTSNTPPPTPGPHEILIRIHAFALNYRDILVTDHSPSYPLVAKPSLTPGSDGAGTIATTGHAVTAWKPGDAVVLFPHTWLRGSARNYVFEQTLGGGDRDGTFQRFVLVGEEYAVRAPAGMGLGEAATLFTAGVTAWNALWYGCGGPGGEEEGRVGRGKVVLTQGTGGVSCYAIQVGFDVLFSFVFGSLLSFFSSTHSPHQIASAAGATVIATSSSDEKLEIARRLGATHTINYRKTPDWSSEALRLTNGAGIDIVVDVVGGADLLHSVASLRYGGRVALLGLLDKEDEPVSLTQPLLYGGKTSKLIESGSSTL